MVVNNITGDLIIPVGGVGETIVEEYERKAANLSLTPARSLYIDSDAKAIHETDGLFDKSLSIGLTGSQVDTIKATPKRFGLGVEKALTEYALKHFNRNQAMWGSRTLRPLTLPAVAYHLTAIIKAINKNKLFFAKLYATVSQVLR